MHTYRIHTADDAAPEDVRGKQIIHVMRDDSLIGSCVLDESLPFAEATAKAVAEVETGRTLEARARADSAAKLAAAQEQREQDQVARVAKRSRRGKRSVLP